MTIELTELTELRNEIRELKQMLCNPNLTKEWYNDEECWQLKGGGSLATYRTNQFYQCKGGRPDAYVGGRKVWSKESVAEWLKLTDAQLEAYHQQYSTGAKRKR